MKMFFFLPEVPETASKGKKKIQYEEKHIFVIQVLIQFNTTKNVTLYKYYIVSLASY